MTPVWQIFSSQYHCKRTPLPFRSTVELKLHKLRQAFVDATELRSYLGEYGYETLSLTNDQDLWGQVQRLLLRVPVTVAESWRERAQKLANKAGFYSDDSERSHPTLPFSRDELLYPGLTGSRLSFRVVLISQGSFRFKND